MPEGLTAQKLANIKEMIDADLRNPNLPTSLRSQLTKLADRVVRCQSAYVLFEHTRPKADTDICTARPHSQAELP